ncbi:MAG: NAD(P)-dependent oxidoreductase [Burkholderiaceae bacterium]
MKLLLAGSFDAAEREAWHALLAAALPGHTLLVEPTAAERRDIEVAIVANPAPGTLQALPRLRLVQSLWAGVDRLLADATLPAGVPLARMVDPALAAAMAETALWAVLSLHRGFFDYQRQQRAALWQQLAQRRADEVAITLLGFGEMGRACAAALVRAGYRVTAWTRSGRGAAMPGVSLIGGDAALGQRLAASEVVINLLPLTADTRGLLDAAFFAAMPRHGAIVNLGRGAHVVDDDLLRALDDDRLHHAVLDVFHTEPLPRTHRYWSHERVTLLPHAAALTDPRSAAAVAAANVRAVAEGRPIAHAVDRARGY